MLDRLILTIALAGLAGCAAGPDYQPPALAAPEAFRAADVTAREEVDQQRFWRGFGDPLLQQLIEQSLEGNNNLEIAAARYQRAAALLYGAERDQWPGLTVSAAASEEQLSQAERFPQGAAARVERYQAGVAASWELDFFGRLRRATEAQAAELAAVGADLQAIQVALAGELASTYFELRGLQQQLSVAEQSVDLQEQSLAIVAARLDAGRASDFDQVRARAQLARSRAQLPVLQAGIRAAMHRIAVLLGKPPAALIDTLSPRLALPETLPLIPLDSPGDVLRRRPDIAAAERRLAAATARVGVAVADLFPRFTLGGLIATLAGDSQDLFSGPAESRYLALGIDWSFLDRGRVRARIAAAGADSRAALAHYQEAVLGALEETETRLVAYRRGQERVEQLQQALEDSERAASLARRRYEQGFIGYFEVLSAEQQLADIRDESARSRTAVSLAMVDLYRSLVGAPQ